tara:strand:- start:563 stop:733 length:171 start_codon:yes stop_codon:yes gene_type:complete
MLFQIKKMFFPQVFHSMKIKIPLNAYFSGKAKKMCFLNISNVKFVPKKLWKLDMLS